MRFCVLCYVFLCFCVLCFVFCVLCYMWPVRAAVMRKPLALLASSPANLPRNVQTQHCNYFPLFTIIKWNPSHNFPVSLCDPSLTYTIILEPYSCPIYRCCGFSNLVLCWDLTWQEITQIFQFFIGVFFLGEGDRGWDQEKTAEPKILGGSFSYISRQYRIHTEFTFSANLFFAENSSRSCFWDVWGKWLGFFCNEEEWTKT